MAINMTVEKGRIRDSIFVLLAGCTEISRIPGLTAAGVSPELTFMTPVVDSEIIVAGKPLSMNDPPMTPDGIPTPAVITRAALQSIEMPVMILNSGLKAKPKVPFMETFLEPANDPTVQLALPEMDRSIEAGRRIGEFLSRGFKRIYLGESVPGGTTTSAIVLNALGYSMETSSSMQHDPTNLKNDLVKKALARNPAAGHDSREVMENFGDYMMSTAVGISSGAGKTEVLFCGGTQMATVYHLDKEINGAGNSRKVITTSWVMNHRPSTLKELVGNDLRIADLNFRDSDIDGLRKYDEGHVREGAGMGGSYYAAREILSDGDIKKKIYGVYSSLLK